MIKVENLRFCFGKTVALDKINISFDKGETTILAGANGAGKTTLLRNICGILNTRSGTITIDEMPVGHQTRKKIAYIPSSLSFYDGLRLGEAIRAHASFYNRFQYRPIGEYRFDMDRRVSGLSRGEKTLFLLTLALSTSPDYLLIDDVVHFLDPHLREIFLNSILQLIEDKELALVIAAQVPVDIEGIVDRVVIFDRGAIVLDESVINLKQKFVKVYGEDAPADQPVIFSKEWQGVKEMYIYPFAKEASSDLQVEHLNLTDILRACIGGEYAHH